MENQVMSYSYQAKSREEAETCAQGLSLQEVSCLTVFVLLVVVYLEGEQIG